MEAVPNATGLHADKVCVSKRRSIFWTIVFIGIALRIIALVLCGPYELHHSDPYNYLQLAHSLLSGRGLVYDDPIYGSQLRATYPPIYPLVLATFGGIFGFSGLAFIGLNGLTDLVTAKILGRHDIRAAAIYFLWPWNLLGSFLAQKESLICLWAVALADIAVRRRDALNTKSSIAFGVFSALLTLTQPAMALFPLMLVIIFFRKADSLFKFAAVALVAALAVLMPWWVRNWLVFGHFVPLTTSGGVALAVVVNENHVAPSPSLMRLNEAVRFPLVGKLAIQHIGQHPLRYLHDVEAQVVNAIFQEKFAISRALRVAPPIWVTNVLAVANIALLGMAALGRNRTAWLLVIACFLALVPTVFMEFGERHRYFLLPFLALLAADFLDRRQAARKETPKGRSLERMGGNR